MATGTYGDGDMPPAPPPPPKTLPVPAPSPRRVYVQISPPNHVNDGRRPFRFMAAWLTHPDFSNMVNNNWNLAGSWSACICHFQNAVKSWNFNVFGNIHKRKNRIMRQLQGITANMNFHNNRFLQDLQVSLWKDYEKILIQEEVMWFQKSSCKWIEFGNRNTKFFHGTTLARRRRNKVESLQDSDGNWVSDKTVLENMASNFYINLYSNNTPDFEFILKGSFPVLPQEDLDIIGNMFSFSEIKDSVFKMGSLKAPDIDGIWAVFYQNQWERVGFDLFRLIEGIFMNPAKVGEVNETLITLIPKVEPVINLKQMRPISLCNVSYKVITKTLINRLRKIMDKIVSPTQCSFVPGRQSSDNIIITQKIIHSMRNKKGSKGWMTIKIDLEKAYDRMRIFWNGDALNEFQPSRGIRQGDPLSPYIFVLCMERLSHLINDAVSMGFWKPIRLSREAPELSHLYFADDLILFSEASVEQADIIKRVLEAFCMSSGVLFEEKLSKLGKSICWTGEQLEIDREERFSLVKSSEGQVRAASDSGTLLTDFLSVSGDWDVAKLKSWLPDLVVQKILAMSPPSTWKEGDHIAWANSADGVFSLKSAYNSLQNDPGIQNHIFKLIWRWKGPERIRYFLWLVAHDAILTNAERIRRHMSQNAACPICQHRDETTMHVLHDCYFARATWNLLQPGNHIADFFNLNHMDWLIKNLSISGDWAVRFGAMLSSLWYARNKQVFEGKSSNPTGVAEAVKSRTYDFSMVMKASITPKKVDTNWELIRWFPPNEDAIKMNVDGSFFSHTGNASCGGLFRNHLEKFVIGFSCNLGAVQLCKPSCGELSKVSKSQ
ncbi:uncharacterized protein [Arachis hypogaea]|uniref:uncharacterized protein n=1 Tax=Arachis hypogaea TaxID=3818 RepID=UPI003B228578